MNIKFLDLYKNLSKKEEKHPDYRMMAKVGQEYIEVGAGWIKKTKPSEKFPEGRQYVSISLNNKLVEMHEATTSDGTPMPNFDKKEINPESIPF